MCLTTIDAKFALPVGVNHLSKGLTAADTLAMTKKEAQEINVCLNHLQHSRTDTNSVPTNCFSHCTDCTELEAVCDACKAKATQLSSQPCNPVMIVWRKRCNALKQQ